MREACTTGPCEGHMAFTVKGICVMRPPLLIACRIITHKSALLQDSKCVFSHNHDCNKIAATRRAHNSRTDKLELQRCKLVVHSCSQLVHM